MNKRWEVLKKDEEGNKYEIHVHLSGDLLKVDCVGITPKGKRKIVFVGNFTDNKYRGYPVAERGEAVRKDILASVPNHLLMEALTETWERLKPLEINL